MDLTRFYHQFREETTENLRILSDGLLALEAASGVEAAGARQRIDAIFRAVHTIKGSARLLGFGAIGRLAHTMENILGAIRDGSHHLDRTLIDHMLKAGDALLEMTVAAVEGRASTVDVDAIIDQLTQCLEGKTSPSPSPVASPSPPPVAPQAPPPDEAGAHGREELLPEAEGIAETDREARREARRARLRELRARSLTGRPPPPDGEHHEAVVPSATASPPSVPSHSALESVAKAGPDATHVLSSAEQSQEPTGETPAPKDERAPNTPPLYPQSSVTSRLSNISRQQTVRVRVDRLDNLMNLTGELMVGKQVLIEHTRFLTTLHTLIQQQHHELTSLHMLLRTMDTTYGARHIPAIEQHLNRLLDINEQARQSMRGQVEQFGRHVDQQRMLIDDLEQEVMAARMLPVSHLFSSLPRAVRELTHATGKEVELIIHGETTELDRKLLEALNDPLLHLVRNAIDHGIEPPSERRAIGKSPRGRVEVTAEASGGEVFITIRDDGRGMEPDTIRSIAVKKGLISRENAALLSDQEALELVFLPGFSSAAMITDISGRGVGMDVVRTNITELGGQVVLESHPGEGSCITLILPMTIATTRVLLVQIGDDTFALPASGCHGIVWAYQEHIHTIEGRAMLVHEGQPVPLFHLGDLIGIGNTHSQMRRREPAVLIGMPQRLLSVLVDKLVDEREAVVKPLGLLFEKQRRYNGAIQLGDGQLVLLLNPVWLAQAARGIAPLAPAAAKPAVQRRPHLMVVEDSFTTRELIRSILQSAGYEVSTAVDGLDALDKLRRQSYDLVVTDVEMPRVDGFELTSRIRDELGLLDLPVVIITSLASEEYRRRGLEAGAQAYIVKSQFNQDNLLRVIQQLLGNIPES